MPAAPLSPRTAALTALALIGFAGNSLLCRMALGERAIDAVSFTSVRLGSGALIMFLIARGTGAAAAAPGAGDLRGALALFVYALAFSVAYLRLTAGTGALILFGFVQLTMLGASLYAGQKPRALEGLGVVVAFSGLVALTFPGLRAPDPLGVAMMACAGVAWGVYSLLGRGSTNALATTAGNFVRSAPLAMLVSAAMGSAAHATGEGVALAVASGALASGVGYSLWYAALPQLSRMAAGVVQLTAPVLAALGGALLLDETLTPRFLGAASAVVFGGLLALYAKR